MGLMAAIAYTLTVLTPPRFPDTPLSSTVFARIVVACCVWVMATGNSPPSSESLPLFTSFKMLCIDTDAKPGAVEAVVAAKRAGHPTRPREFATVMPGGYDHRSKGWTLVVGSRELEVVSVVAYSPAHRDWPAYEIDSCSVQGANNDGPSVAATRTWVGVRPDRETDSLVTYAYEQLGSKRVPATHPDKAAFIKAIAAGNYYTLRIVRHEGMTVLIISRYHLSIR